MATTVGRKLVFARVVVVVCLLMWVYGWSIGDDSPAGVPLAGLGIIGLCIVIWMGVSGRLSRTSVRSLPMPMSLYAFLCVGLALYFSYQGHEHQHAQWNVEVHQTMALFQYIYAFCLVATSLAISFRRPRAWAPVCGITGIAAAPVWVAVTEQMAHGQRLGPALGTYFQDEPFQAAILVGQIAFVAWFIFRWKRANAPVEEKPLARAASA
jgi:hypothetical protein